MAEKSIIISAEEEAILLKPIDEYVGKIQEQIDALRVEGSDKVNSLKNQIAIAKENKNLTKEEQNKIIGECKKNLEKAKATEDANKQQIAKLIADAEGFLSKHYNSEYYNIVAKSCEAEKKAENSNFEKLKADLQEEHKKAVSSLKDAEEIKAEKYTYKNKLYDAQMTHESRIQEIKDRKHDAYMHKFHLIDLLRMSKYTFAQKQAQNSTYDVTSADHVGTFVEYDGLVVNISNYTVTFEGHNLEMPPKELEILYFLSSRPNQVFTREQLLDKLWGYEYVGDTRTVDVHIKRLREKLNNNHNWSIATVWGIGYKFEWRAS